MNASLDTSIDIKHYVRMFWRRRGMIVLCAVTVICAALVGLEFVPEEYESVATMSIEDRQRLASSIESVMGGLRAPARGWRAEEERMDKLMGRVRSRPFLEKVVRLLRMNEDPIVVARAQASLASVENPQLTVDELATRMMVNSLRSKVDFTRSGSGIYTFTVRDHDASNAQLLAKWVSELFVDVSIQASIDELRVSHEFGSEQMRIYQEKLERSEAALEQYRSSQIERDLESGTVGANNVNRAETLYQRVLDEAELARVRVLPVSRTVSSAGLDRAATMLIDDPEIRNQADGLATVLQEAISGQIVADSRQAVAWPPAGSYLNLRRGLYQLIVDKAAQVAGAQPQEALDALVSYVYSTVDREAHAKASNFLGQAISNFKNRARTAPRGEMELQRLEAEVESNRSLLRSFQAQLVASEVSQAMEMTDLGLRIEVLDPPQQPLKPASPDRTKILLAALLLGPLLGAGVAFGTEILDTTLRHLNDFEREFDGPILGTTPLLFKVEDPVAVWRRYWLPASIVGIVALTVFFFLTRDTLFEGVVDTTEVVQIIDPGSSVNP